MQDAYLLHRRQSWGCEWHQKQSRDQMPTKIVGDNVQTKFKVENVSGQYREDIWYAWLDDTWTKIPPEKIVSDFSPNGQGLPFHDGRHHPMLRTAERRTLIATILP